MGKTDFLKQYQQLRAVVVPKEFHELDDIEHAAIRQFKQLAQSVYQEIAKSRQIGIEYLVAALSYFHQGTEQILMPEQYLILRASYFFYHQYEMFEALDGAQAKQKEVCDVLRYIAKPILEHTDDVQLREESQQLLKLYLIFMLQSDELKQNVYQAWQAHIEKTLFQQPKIASYLRTLTIIFKRLAQKRVVRRSRKKRNSIKGWPSQADLKHSRDKRPQSVFLDDYPARITTISDVTIDENGDLDVMDESLSIHSTDLSTARFNKVINAHTAHLMRHRQRRLQPFVTNSHYMSRDVLRHWIYILNFELFNQNKEVAAIAAACLLSITTGLSPVALLDYSQLITDGILIQQVRDKKTEYQLRLNLDITQQKIEILKGYQLNQTVSHDLYLSSSWFDYLNLKDVTQLITAQDVTQYLKKWSVGQQVGSISIEKLQAQLYFHIFYDTFNEYIAHVLSGKDSHHELPGSFYNGVVQQQLNDTYLIYLEALHPQDLSENFELIQQQFNTPLPAEQTRFGSQLALIPTFVCDFFTTLSYVCLDQIQSDKHVIERLNAYSVWMWHIHLLCLASRPKEGLLGNRMDYDLALKLLYVNDKKNSRSRKDGRFVVLSDFFIQAFHRYITFLEQMTIQYADLFNSVFKKKWTVDDVFGNVIVYPKSLPVTAQQWQSKKIQCVPISRGWVNQYLAPHVSVELYNNWLRHFDMNMLMQQGLSFNVIQALYGHDQRDQELFYRYSSASLQQYIKDVSTQMDQLIQSLNLKHLA